MKKSVQVHKDVEELLMQHLKAHRNENFNSVVNDALSMYLTAVRFDDAAMRKRGNYKLVVLRVHAAVVRLLEMLKNNFDVKAVCEGVTFFLMQEFSRQSGRLKWPDRAYCGAEYINKLAEKLLMRLRMM